MEAARTTITLTQACRAMCAGKAESEYPSAAVETEKRLHLSYRSVYLAGNGYLQARTWNDCLQLTN